MADLKTILYKNKFCIFAMTELKIFYLLFWFSCKNNKGANKKICLKV